MEGLKGKHIYGMGAAVVGIVALLYALLTWFINRTLDTNVQAGFALGLVGLAVFAWLEIDWLTRLLKTRQMRYGAEALALTLLFLVVVGLLNYIFTRDRLGTVPLQGRWDLTEDQQHSLAPETINMLNTLQQPVRVLAFYTTTSFGREDVEVLLKNYKDKSGGKVDYEFVDPITQPAIVQKYGVTREGSLVVTRDEKFEEVQFGSDEAALTNAIVRLNDSTLLTVYFISGHGEDSIDEPGDTGLSQLKELLEGVNYQVKSLNAISQTIPEDASAIVIAGPTRQFSPEEVQTIDTYLAAGGKAVVLYEPSPLTGLEPGQTDPLVQYLSTRWGLILNDDFILDQTSFVQGPEIPATTNYGSTPVSKGLEGVNTIFPLARSITLAGPGVAPAEVSLSPVVSTMPGLAWAETNVAALTDPAAPVEQGPEEAAGQLVIGATAENTATGGRVIVFGDKEFGQNQFWQQQLANGFLLLNSIKWATTREDQISLTPRDSTIRTLNVVNNRDVAIVFLLACLLPPLLVIIGGVAVWWSRRLG
jgi:ABC-type uncharacterized transport system involved in gliding motility auxiliary subunit